MTDEGPEYLDARIEEHYDSLLEESDRLDALGDRAEELKKLLTQESQIPKLLSYATARRRVMQGHRRHARAQDRNGARYQEARPAT
jgi:hypothetical protein